MGKPSQVDDLQAEFAGLSPEEDDYLVPHRDSLSKRAVWYVKKSGKLPNLKDTWYAAYFSSKDQTLVHKMLNPPPGK